MPRRSFLCLIPSLLLAACDPTAVAPQPAAVSASPSAAVVIPAATPSAVATPTPVPTPTPTATPKPSPTPPKAPAPAVEGSVVQYQDPTLPVPSAGAPLSNVSVTAYSKTVDKPYYREVVASPRFEFTDLPYEAEIEITAAKEGWARGVTTITTGKIADRKAISLIMKRVYYY